MDTEGELFFGITIKWDYIKCTVRLSMPDYARLALEQFQHFRPTAKTDAPHEWKEHFNGCKWQYADNPDTPTLLSQEKKTYVQQVIRVFLYYARAADLTILTALNSITESQASPTENNLSHCTQLIDYLSWNQQADIGYKRSDTKLCVHGDATYIVAEKARSHILG